MIKVYIVFLEYKLKRKMDWKNHLMKHFYRLSQSQRFYGIIAAMLIISALYYENIPILQDWGFWGKIVLAIIVFIVFIIFGYIYDRKLRLWEQDHIIMVERNPYNYNLLTEKEKKIYGVFLVQMNSLKKINGKLKIRDESLNREIRKLKKWING